MKSEQDIKDKLNTLQEVHNNLEYSSMKAYQLRLKITLLKWVLK